MKGILRQPYLILVSILLTTNLLVAQTTSWSGVVSPTTNNLYGVAYSNQDTIVAVGDLGTILRSTDGGNSWSIISSPVGDPLRAVSFHGDVGLAVGISGRILRTTDAGLTWSELAQQTTKNLYSVSMDNRTAVITGEEGTILHSSDSGVTWASSTAGTAAIIFGVSAYGDSVIAGAGQGYIINSLSGGSTWGLQMLGNPTQLFFYGASLPNGVVGYVVGINGSSSIILRTDNTGFAYTLQTYSGTATLNGVSFTSPDTGTIVGTSGTILHTSNGGTLWKTEVSGTTQSLSGVAFLNPTRGIAVGDGGTILLNEVATNISSQVLSGSHLYQNFPNPFGSSTLISYQLSKAEKVKLVVYDLAGKEITILVNDFELAGPHSVQFNAANFSEGEYLYKIECNSFTGIGRMEQLK